MNFGLLFTAAFGLAASLALSAPASAATIDYNLVGDAEYADPAWPGFTFIDLADAGTGSTVFPGYTLNVGDIIQVTVTLNNPASFNWFEIVLQETNETTTIWFDPTLLFSLGGVTVPEPSSEWSPSVGVTGALGFGAGFYTDVGTFSFDKVIVNAVITALTDPSGGNVSSMVLTQMPYPPYVGLYNPSVATTPLPAGLWLMMTALGGLGIVARRKRTAASIG